MRAEHRKSSRADFHLLSNSLSPLDESLKVDFKHTAEIRADVRNATRRSSCCNSLIKEQHIYIGSIKAVMLQLQQLRLVKTRSPATKSKYLSCLVQVTALLTQKHLSTRLTLKPYGQVQW